MEPTNKRTETSRLETVKYLDKRTHVVFSFAFCSFQNFKNLQKKQASDRVSRGKEFVNLSLLNRQGTYDGAPSFAVKEGLFVRKVKPETETQAGVTETSSPGWSHSPEVSLTASLTGVAFPWRRCATGA